MSRLTPDQLLALLGADTADTSFKLEAISEALDTLRSTPHADLLAAITGAWRPLADLKASDALEEYEASPAYRRAYLRAHAPSAQ